MAAVRVPPSAWITSQSIQIVRSFNKARSMMERNERPMSLCISWVLPVTFPLVDSLGALIGVELGSKAYSAVIQPSPVFLIWGGTLSSTVAVQMILVLPVWTRTEPGAYLVKCLLIIIGRSSSGTRLSTLMVLFTQ